MAAAPALAIRIRPKVKMSQKVGRGFTLFLAPHPPLVTARGQILFGRRRGTTVGAKAEELFHDTSQLQTVPAASATSICSMRRLRAAMRTPDHIGGRSDGGLAGRGDDSGGFGSL